MQVKNQQFRFVLYVDLQNKFKYDLGSRKKPDMTSHCHKLWYDSPWTELVEVCTL